MDRGIIMDLGDLHLVDLLNNYVHCFEKRASPVTSRVTITRVIDQRETSVRSGKQDSEEFAGEQCRQTRK